MIKKSKFCIKSKKKESKNVSYLLLFVENTLFERWHNLESSLDHFFLPKKIEPHPCAQIKLIDDYILYILSENRDL